MKRVFDVTLALTALAILFVPLVFIATLVRLTSRGPAIYWSERIGRNNVLFRMPKFRTMLLGTPVVATHLLQSPGQHVTAIGAILRRTSLDELPQLLSIVVGDMSFVGPRPALFNQHDLVALRTSRGIHRLMPGLTGWAQINGRDELPIDVKVAFDQEYLERKSLVFDLQILTMTAWRAMIGSGVAH
jgi:O-antigen biosynthesis protein WbqP